MNAPIDKNINSFFKGFLTGDNYSDPTYLGFKFIFDFTSSRNMETGETNDPLFAEAANLDSAIRYLSANGYANRSQMLQQFKANLQDINTNTPWYWQSVSGLKDLWKIEFGEEFNPRRGKEKVLEITCLESIDLRITVLADLYRKATFDAKYMRSLLPMNLKWFTLKLQIAEMRSFQQIQSTLITPENPNTSIDNISSIPPNANTLPIGANTRQDVTSQSSSNPPLAIQNIDNLISVIEFQLQHCTFDFWESFPSEEGTINMDGTMNMAKQKFKIKVGRLVEKNQYNIADLILMDGLSQETGFGSFNVQVPNFDKTFTSRNDAIFSTVLQGSQNDNNLVNSAINVLNGFISENQQLGNVYPLTPATITLPR